jgi:predicted MFS family arabinose efflux permease
MPGRLLVQPGHGDVGELRAGGVFTDANDDTQPRHNCTTDVAVAVSSFLAKFLLASRTGLDARARANDIDYRLLVPLLLHSIIIQAVYAIVRVTTSYRAIELNLPVLWLGAISATFAILPIFLAVWVGRFMDRGNDAPASWLGSGLLVLACAGFRFVSGSMTTLLLFTALLGVSHLLLMASQQMLCIRCAGPRGRDSTFGNYLVASAIGQGIGPYLIAWTGGSATLPPTGKLFTIGFVIALASLATASAIRPAPKHLTHAKSKDAEPLRTLLRQPGLMAVLVASVITITSQDLLTIYLPLLGAEHNIDVRVIGSLLTVRSIASLVSRLGYVRIVRLFPRRPLTLVSMLGAGVGFAGLALPVPLSAMFAAMAVMGFSLGIATTLSLTNVVDLASAAAIGTVMSLRITGNRIGQVALPFMASLVAAATGVGGIFVIIALSLAASGAAVHFSRHEP